MRFFTPLRSVQNDMAGAALRSERHDRELRSVQNDMAGDALRSE